MNTKRLSERTRRMMAVLRGGVLAGVWAIALSAGAEVYTITSSGDWSADTSWSGTKPSAGGSADDVIVFNGSGAIASTNNLSGSFQLTRLEAAAGTFTLWGNTLSFVNSGATGPQVVQTGGTATFRNALSLANETVFDVANGVLSVNSVFGAGGLVKTGAGELFCATDGNGALSFRGHARRGRHAHRRHVDRALHDEHAQPDGWDRHHPADAVGNGSQLPDSTEFRICPRREWWHH